MKVGARWITWTGGEPFLQKNDELEELCEILRSSGFQQECFSNGTIEYPEWATRKIYFIMDWKLPGSGEDPLNQTRTMHNLSRLQNGDAVKFVCKNHNDLIVAHSLWSSYIMGKLPTIGVYYGKVWDGDITDAELAEYVMREKLPWKLNVQLHNYIWPANERGR